MGTGQDEMGTQRDATGTRRDTTAEKQDTTVEKATRGLGRRRDGRERDGEQNKRVKEDYARSGNGSRGLSCRVIVYIVAFSNTNHLEFNSITSK